MYFLVAVLARLLQKLMPDLEQRISALENEVRQLQAHRDIGQLIASYGPVVDTADNPERAQKVAALWAIDGSYDVDGVGDMHGRTAIARCYEANHFDMVPEGCAHVMSLPVVTVNGDIATAISYSCVFRPKDEIFFVWRVSANYWQLACNEKNQWQVEKRTNRLMKGTPEALALLRNIDHFKF